MLLSDVRVDFFHVRSVGYGKTRIVRDRLFQPLCAAHYFKVVPDPKFSPFFYDCPEILWWGLQTALQSVRCDVYNAAVVITLDGADFTMIFRRDVY